MHLGTLKYIMHFALLPKNIFPQYEGNIKQREYVWMQSYYKVYKWSLIMWVPNKPFFEGWVWVGNVKKITT